MPTISEYVRPREWIAAIRSPVVVRTRHGATKCRRYFRRKQEITVRPAHDRDVQLRYRIRAEEDGFRLFRTAAGLRDSPLGFALSVEEEDGGAVMELRLALLPWFGWAAGGSISLLVLVALFVMDWWPCILTLGILCAVSIGGLHMLATDRNELSRFLADRFGEAEDDWFPGQEDA